MSRRIHEANLRILYNWALQKKQNPKIADCAEDILSVSAHGQ